MAQFFNLILLCGCAVIAYLITQFVYLKVQQFEIWYDLEREKKDMLYRKKIQKLKNSAYDYYYTMAINTPELLANENAEKIINNLRKKREINKMYSKLRVC